MIAYIAGPIDGVDEYERTWWIEVLCKALHEVGVVTYRPLFAIGQVDIAVLQQNAEFIRRINRAAIETCDVLVAYLGGKGRGLGTIREIEYARSIGKPVYVIGTFVSIEAYDLGMVHTELMGNPETWRKVLASHLSR